MRVLFICTHNRCRSILAEAIARQLLGSRESVRSAGSQPEGRVHPRALEALEAAGYGIDGLRSKSWDEMEGYAPDLIITLCDSAAGEVCPVWFGDAERQHWGLADPSLVVGSEADIAAAFAAAILELEGLVAGLAG
jgi:arsenate reductase